MTTRETQAWIHNRRFAKYLPLVAVLLLPLLIDTAFERSPSTGADAGPGFRRATSKSARHRETAPPPRLEQPLTRRVFLIILDAWRRQVALDDTKMPHLADLGRRGSRGTVLTGIRTYTKPCVRALMTGRNSDLRDAALNLLSDPVSEESLMSRLNAAGYLYTLIDATPAFPGLFERQCRPGSLIRASVLGLAWDAADPAHDSQVEQASFQALDDPRRVFIMIHLESEDLAGHLYGPKSDAYERVLQATDDRIARLASRLDFARDTLIVIGDHGSDDLGHHGGPEYSARETAYLALGAGIRSSNRPFDPLDLADSVAILLGVCPPVDSTGAPDANLLAISPTQLKVRCDRCLRERLQTLPGPTSRWLSTSEARRYFEATEFGPDVSQLYQRVASPLPEERRSWRVVAVGIATMLVSVLTLLLPPTESRVRGLCVAVLVLLALVPPRDSVALVLYALLLASVSTYDRGLRRLAGFVAAAALLVRPFFAAPTPFLYKLAGDLGFAALILGSLILGIRAFQPSRWGKAGRLALPAVAASIAISLVPSYHLPGVFSPSVALIDFALAAGALFMILGFLLEEEALTGLAGLALAGCFFHGWPLLIFVLLEIFLLGRPPNLPRPLSQAILWAPVGGLALLRAENGGYGFSKIDLSLAVLGKNGDAIDYRWAAAMILLSYLLPLLLSVRVAMKMTGKSLPVNLSALLSALLIFSGADLVFVALPSLDRWGVGGHEEIFAFDVALSALVCVLQAVVVAGSLLRKGRAFPGVPVPDIPVARSR